MVSPRQRRASASRVQRPEGVDDRAEAVSKRDDGDGAEPLVRGASAPSVPGRRAQRHPAHLPLQSLSGGSGRAWVGGEEAREVVGGAAHQRARRAVEEHDGDDAVVGGHGEEQAVDAGWGGALAPPAAAAGEARGRAVGERELAARAAEIGEVGRVGLHDGAERRRPCRRRAAGGAPGYSYRHPCARLFGPSSKPNTPGSAHSSRPGRTDQSPQSGLASDAAAVHPCSYGDLHRSDLAAAPRHRCVGSVLLLLLRRAAGDPRSSWFHNDLCNNCKRPGHFARECPSVAVCHTCGLPGHIAAECSSKSICWNCKEPGHMANSCPNEGICRNCGKSGHIARDCTAPPVPPGEVILCSNCYKPGHFREECTNEKACNNCRQSGHIARNCTNDPVCNLCNVAGHLARQCPKSDTLGERGGPPPFRGIAAPFYGGGAPLRGGFSDVVCRACNQVGHMSRDCMAGAFMICHNCGGRGHNAYECPSVSLMDRVPILPRPRRF
ncbi:hypothetical protein U9M48_007912 [Paspalum notatum var. saurae]|uniref:CCHC-type domain-containing protein n=1 Tax=Paspalum notatum var. saurae TaxID=547442 RepID=A0AAQ3SN46_PASNO